MNSSYTRAYTTARDVLFDAFITSDGEPTSFARECNCDIMQDWSAGTTKVIFDDASEITFHDADFTVNGLSAAARAMGLIGGATKSPERAAASRENGRLGGRPKYQYNITSRDGETQGTYAGVTPAHALAAMYRVAGYRVRVNRSGKLIFADDGAQDLCGQIDDWIIRQVK